jgi:hypothetical protein
MNIMSYLDLIKQFFFKKAHSFTVRIGADRLTISVSVEAADATHTPFAISFSQALQLVALVQDHATTAPVSPLSFNAYIDGNINVLISVSSV